MTDKAYTDFVSDEPLDIIRANECEHDESSLCTQRFRRLWNEIVALRSAADRLDAGWLPIESAPRDGTEIGLWIVYRGELAWARDPFERYSVGYWDEGCTNPGFEREAGWDKKRIGNPTHWRPLPPPPSNGTEQTTGDG